MGGAGTAYKDQSEREKERTWEAHAQGDELVLDRHLDAAGARARDVYAQNAPGSRTPARRERVNGRAATKVEVRAAAKLVCQQAPEAHDALEVR